MTKFKAPFLAKPTQIYHRWFSYKRTDSTHALEAPSMLYFLFCYLLSLAGGAQSQRNSPLGPVVDIGYAAYAGNTTSPSGVLNGPVTFFGAVPYAQPPLRDLRFRRPRPLKEDSKSSIITDARSWGPPCIQRPAVVGIGSEGVSFFECVGIYVDAVRS